MTSEKRRIALIGGNATVAKYLAPVLRQNHDVVTYGRHGCDYVLDVQGDGPFILAPACTTAIYLAAGFKAQTDADILATVSVNIGGAIKSCMAARQAGIPHFVLVSSIYTQLPDGHPYNTVYSLSKRQAEEWVTRYCRDHGMALTILRPAPIYDAVGLCRPHQGMLYRMVDCAANNQDITLYGAHDAVRNYIFMDDVVQVITRLVAGRVTGTFSCLFPQNCTVREMAEAAMAAFSSTGRICVLPDKDPIPDTLFPMTGNPYSIIGFTPQVTMAEGMRRIAAAYQKSKAGAA